MRTVQSIEAQGLGAEAVRRRLSLPRSIARFVRTKPLGAAGACLLLALLVTAIFAPWIAPYDPYQVHTGARFAPPGRQFLVGSDEFGRDSLSRIIHGARISLKVAFLAVTFGTTVGAVLGVVSGYYGGKTDLFVQRIMDSIEAFPGLILALAVVAVLGPSATNVMLAIAVVLVPSASRVTRSCALSVKETQYALAARAVGCSDSRIILAHIVPNCLAPYIVLATAVLGGAIIIEAALSFLGLGTPPPEPSWGQMLTSARAYLYRAPWLALYPGIAISLAVFGFNLFGDALRDVWDPRLRRG